MLHDIPTAIAGRMRFLEQMDARHRAEELPAEIRLRQIPPDTGRFIALVAAGAPRGSWIEIGTSGGYSALWLVLAARSVGARLTTFEILPDKAKLARETFRLAGVEAIVDLVEGDARYYLDSMSDISFCFLDAEKDVYQDCYDLIIPRMAPGGILIADNALSHQEYLQPMIDRTLADTRVAALVVPICRGELVCRKLGHS